VQDLYALSYAIGASSRARKTKERKKPHWKRLPVVIFLKTGTIEAARDEFPIVSVPSSGSLKNIGSGCPFRGKYKREALKGQAKMCDRE
jgi:hypothetical protein